MDKNTVAWMLKEIKTGLYRGVITIHPRYAMESFKVYTFWYRHDEVDLAVKLRKIINDICDAYMADANCESVSYGIEHRDYQR